MFIDRVVVEVRSGKGGDGMIAFLHEKYVAKGGPSGGNQLTLFFFFFSRKSLLVKMVEMV